jgi:hypothetical protein
VSSKSEFAAAIASMRRSGGIVVLLPGRYGELLIGPRGEAALTVQGRAGVSVGRLRLVETRAVKVVGLQIRPGRGHAVLQVDRSSDVTLSRLTVTAAGTRKSSRIELLHSSQVTISRSTFSRCGESSMCVLPHWSTDVVISDNRFRDCRGCDFIRGRFSSRLAIRANSFHRALVGRCGTDSTRCNHNDLVQLQAGTGLTVENNDFGVYELPGAGQLALFGPLEDVTIRNNLFRHTDPRAPGVEAHVGINLGGRAGLPKRVVIANNTILSGHERSDNHLNTSIRLKPEYVSLASGDRPVIANNILHLARSPESLCAVAQLSEANVFIDGVPCSASDVVGDPMLDEHGRPTAESALVIGRASPVWAPVTDIIGTPRDTEPDIGAYEYVPGERKRP